MATNEEGEATVQRLSRDAATARLRELDPDWELEGGAQSETVAIVRRFEVKGFAKAVYLANLVAFHADREHHHPDIAFGFGYCRVRYTTHDVGGLSARDFDSAARLDALTAGARS